MCNTISIHDSGPLEDILNILGAGKSTFTAQSSMSSCNTNEKSKANLEIFALIM
jgi:hypothetical protein